MIKRQKRFERLRSIEREYLAALVAVTLLEERLRVNPAFGKDGGWRKSDAIKLRDNLEATFLLRMFAEFESGLRDVWLNSLEQTTQPPMKDLLVGLAARRGVPPNWVDAAHRVRLFRNSLVHEGETKAGTVSILDARNILCSFFSCMPEDW